MKKFWIFFISAFLLACSCSIPSGVVNLPVISTPSVTCRPPEPPHAQDAARFTLVQLHPADGNLSVQLQAEAPKAAALGQHMFVEFDASW
jgi:hypothetical protein